MKKTMEDFKAFVQEQELRENIFRKFLDSVRKTIARVVRASISRFKKVKPGQSVRIRFSLPSTLSENIQTAKAGGELAELALLNELATLLSNYISSTDGIPKSSVSERVYFNNGMDQKSWKTTTYAKADKSYNSSAKTAVDKKEKTMWISHGKTAGKLLFDQIKKELGGDISYTNIQMLHEGQDEIGKSKKDFSIILHKHDEAETKRTLGFSMKATLKGSPYETPAQAYQSGYAATVLGLITGKYSKEMEDMGGDISGYVSMVNRLKTIEDPDQRAAQLQKIKSSYEKTYLYTLDKLGSEMGYGTTTLKGNQIPDLSRSSLLLGQYLDALSRYFKDSKKQRRAEKDSGERGTRSSYSDEFTMHVNDYVEIIYDVLEQEINKNPTAIIRRILKFGGIEEDLYYIAAGLSPNDSTASAAVSTLFNGEWENMRDSLLKSRSLSISLERQTNSKGANNIYVKITSNGLGLTKKWKAGTTLVRFKIWKDDKDGRISLPKFFEEDMVKVDQRPSANGKKMVGGKTVDQNSLLRRYATGERNMK